MTFLDIPSKLPDIKSIRSFGERVITDKNRECVIGIEKIVAGGAGMGRSGGKVVFTPRTLPGEEVRARITREKKDYAEAEPVEILSPSPFRVSPVCPLFGVCGGCDFQHTDYHNQTEIKKTIVRETLRRIARFELQDVPCEESAPFAYRSRVQLHRIAPARENSPLWGFRKAASSELVPVERCPVAAGEINDFLASREDCSSREKIHVFGWNGRAAFGANEEIRIELCGKPLSFSPECFFQSNIPLLEKLIRHACEGLRGDYALDLYAGAGTFGLFLAEGFRRVVSVEGNPSSAAWAQRNLAGARVFPGAVEDWLRTREADAAPDLIVLDPPRTGLSAAARAFLKKAGSPLLLYISCDVASLARDLAFLLENGYNMTEYRLFDFYPQTAHVESLCRLTRNS
ncbi:MAG: TRAM domain-containing protein [Spirochaetaceae bacterium]|nr:TRAM domain-containing protein [Spirochaetaceae bacterium]